MTLFRSPSKIASHTSVRFVKDILFVGSGTEDFHCGAVVSFMALVHKATDKLSFVF